MCVALTHTEAPRNVTGMHTAGRPFHWALHPNFRPWHRWRPSPPLWDWSHLCNTPHRSRPCPRRLTRLHHQEARAHSLSNRDSKSRVVGTSVRMGFQTPVPLIQSTDDDHYHKQESPKNCGMCTVVISGVTMRWPCPCEYLTLGAWEAGHRGGRAG